jgi:tripartite-type tricarboxylate transporter receptor subunit TctC
MIRTFPRCRLGTAMLVLAQIAASTAAAQDFPTRPIRIIVPYAAGGLPDTMTRIVRPRLTESLGQQIVVENRGGAGGIVGTEQGARAPADGYTLVITDVGQVAINPHLYSKLPYDPFKDLAPIGLIGTSTLFLTVNLASGLNSFQDLVALLKANPGKYNYGSSGTGTVLHLGVEALNTAFGLQWSHVPYKGTGESVPALLSGQVLAIYSALPSISSHLKAGKLRALAQSTSRRSAQAPDLPTVAELGVPGYDFAPTIGIMAPAGTPVAIINRLSSEITRAVKHPDTMQRFAQLGIDPVGSTPESYAALIRSDYERYARVVKASGARVD